MSLRAAAAWAVVAVVAWLAASDVLNNYDTAYSLLWGTDLVEGRAPDLEVALAPTPHPLATAFGALLGLLPDASGAMRAWNAVALVALAVLGWLVLQLGRAWFGLAAGVVAAVLVLTREPVLSFGLRAYLDLPYLCLLLGALLVETRRPRAGTPVLVLVGLAGLLRPEAWLLAGLYGLWLWRGGALRPVHAALVVAAPAIWVLHDAVLTGDPLWSLTGTQDNADALGRVTGLQNVPTTAPRRLGEILREPVLLAAAGGLVLTWLRLRDRVRLPLAAGAGALVAFCVLATAGLPILTRYLLLPGTLLALVAAAGLVGWRLLPDGDTLRRPWMAFGAVCAVALLAFAPAQADRLDRLTAALDRQESVLAQLRDLEATRVPAASCAPFTLPNRRAIPQLRLWSGLGPDAVRSGIDDGVRGTYFAPATPEVAREFVLDRRDRDQRLPEPPRDAPLVGRPAWLVYLDCRPTGAASGER